jgi:transcriptional regulator with XRE-family HTH domain
MACLRLKELRDSKKMNQADVAEHLQIARTTYARYESGEREMTYDALITLAALFSVSVDYLLGRYDNDSTVLDYTEKNVIDKYRALDKRGQQSVQAILEHEYSQLQGATKKSAM